MQKVFSSSVEKKLNTKGCCFLCLTVIADDSTSEASGTRPLDSLKSLQRHFRIRKSKNEEKKKQTSSESQDEGVKPPPFEQDIKVELCNRCGRVLDKFKNASASVEKAQMEMNFWSERLHCQISEGSKKPEQVQIYSKRMTSDPETLTQLVFVDNLRKEIARKSLSMKLGSEAKICLHQSKLKPKKEHLVSHLEDTSENPLWSPSEEDNFNNDIDSPEQDHAGSGSSDNEIETGFSTVVTIKQEMGEFTGTSSFFTHEFTDAGSRTLKKKSGKNKFYTRNTEMGTFDCPVCKKQSKTQGNANKHYEIVHLRLRKYKCDICCRGYSTGNVLQKHKKKCDGTKKRSRATRGTQSFYNSNTGKHGCVQCKKEFKYQEEVRNHYFAAHAKQSLKCDICNISVFKNMRSLRFHRKSCKALHQRRKDNEYEGNVKTEEIGCPS